MAILLNNTRQKDLIKQAAIAYTKEHKVDMCTVFEETWQEGLNEGLERGIEQGVSQGENNMRS